MQTLPLPLTSLAFLILIAGFLILLVHRIFRRLAAAGTPGLLEIQMEHLKSLTVLAALLYLASAVFLNGATAKKMEQDARDVALAA